MSAALSSTKRLMKEMQAWRAEQQEADDGGGEGIERLGPVGDDLLHWEAVINGRGIDGGYDSGCCSASIPFLSFPAHISSF